MACDLGLLRARWAHQRDASKLLYTAQKDRWRAVVSSSRPGFSGRHWSWTIAVVLRDRFPVSADQAGGGSPSVRSPFSGALKGKSLQKVRSGGNTSCLHTVCGWYRVDVGSPPPIGGSMPSLASVGRPRSGLAPHLNCTLKSSSMSSSSQLSSHRLSVVVPALPAVVVLAFRGSDLPLMFVFSCEREASLSSQSDVVERGMQVTWTAQT